MATTTVVSEASTERSIEFDCPAGVNPFPVGDFWAPDARVVLAESVVANIRVCTSRQGRRLKGIRITGSRVRQDGTLIHVPASDQEAMANCGDWSPMSICPAGGVGSGLVVHAGDIGPSRHGGEIVGLQLICRSVEVR